MKYPILIILLFLILPTFVFPRATAPGKTSLSGKITDKQTGEPLPGVTIYIPDLKTGTVTNDDGTYMINDLPEIKIFVQVAYIGYKLIAEQIDLSLIKTKDFKLEEAHSELNEVVITGLSRSTERNRTPTPISTIAQTELLENVSENIIDAIAKQPGISQITTGVGISKPVIRGLGYNRVVTVHDEIRQEGQQWGDEHGIEIDEFGISKIEILKGPASLAYGSDAMAGVIHLMTAPTLPQGEIKGNVLANYQTNNGLIGLSGNIAGNQSGFIWDIRYSHKQAHAYQNKYDGFVLNSNFKENAASGIVGLNKSWGYSHLHLSTYSITPGIIDGERDSVTGKFLKEIPFDDSTTVSVIATEDDLKAYSPIVPFQKIQHRKAILNNSFILGAGSLKATFGFQQNQRKEFGDVIHPEDYGLYFLLNTLHYEIRYLLQEKEHWNLSFGLNGMSQYSRNKGSEFLVPAYRLLDMGGYGIASLSLGKLYISGGMRYDVRTEKGKELFLDREGNPVASATPDATQKFSSFKSVFNGLSGSAGATYQFFEKVFSKINFSLGFRAPNIGELASNGEHEGTLRYEIGDAALASEHSFQVDYALGFNDEHMTAELALFSNHIRNFIYLQKLQSEFGGDSLRDDLSAYKFTSGNANLIGGEFTIDFHPHPLDWLHFENSISYVLAKQIDQPDSTRYLPFTPPLKWAMQLKASAKKIGKTFSNAYLLFEAETNFKQDKIFSAFNTETPTPAYTILNFGLGTEVMSAKSKLCSFYFFANNITDVTYQSHLSRLKYADINVVSGNRGVFNMGRNFSFKILIPIV